MARKYGKKASETVEQALRKWKRGTLKSGSGRKVTLREQAIAIGLSEARAKGYKVPPERHHATMAKTGAQLDAEIAEFLAKPQKLLDPAWEREWADLLAEKHAKARMPTIEELARAYSYIEREYVIKGGRIGTEQWAEGLAFGQRSSIDAEDKRQAKEMLKQLSTGAWLRVAERANYLAREQGEAARYLK